MVWLTWVGALVVAIGLTSMSTMQLIYRLLRAGSFGTLALTRVMHLIANSTAMWWVSEARHAPQFMHSVGGSVFVSGPRGAPWPLVWVGLLMVLGLMAASVGTCRLGSGWGRDREAVASSWPRGPCELARSDSVYGQLTATVAALDGAQC